jgi:uncharacterized membrane-anchored protein
MSVRHWPIAVVIGVQLAVLAAIPIRAMRTRATGADVTLWTAPVDPFDVMSGYYVTLAYEAERTNDAPKVEDGAAVWVTVRRAEPAWTAVSVRVERPAASDGELSLHARWKYGRAHIDNAGRLYIPEAERDRATKLLADAKGRGLVDLKVDADGNVSVLRLRVGDATFGERR